MNKIKRMVALAMIAAFVLSCMPVITFAEIQSGVNEEGLRNWIFEGFDDQASWNNPRHSDYKVKDSSGNTVVGATSHKGLGYPRGWSYQATYWQNTGHNSGSGDNDQYKFGWAGTEIDGFFGFNYPTARYALGNSVAVNRIKDDSTIDVDFETRALSERIDLGVDDWIDFDGKIIISYDVLLPSLQEIADGASVHYGCDLMQEAKITNNGTTTYSRLYYAAVLPKVGAKYSNGAATLTVSGLYTRPGLILDANPKNISTHGASASMDITDKAGKWVTIQSVLERFDEAGIDNDKYCVKNYIDGELITNGANDSVAWFNPTEYAIEALYRNPNGTIEYVAPYLQFYEMKADNFWGGVDNIRMSLYDRATIDKTLAVDENTTVVDIPVYNTAIETPDAPERVKYAAVANWENLDIVATKYSADDIFGNNGQSVDVTISSVNPDKKYATALLEHYNSSYDVELNGEKLYLNIPTVADGEKLVIELRNAKDLFGEELENNTIILYNTDGVLNVSGENYFGEELRFEYDSEQNMNIAPMDIKKITVGYPAGAWLSLSDGENDVLSVSNENDINYIFNLSSFLEPETVYYIMDGTTELLSFKTGTASLSYDEPVKTSSGNKYKVRYVNTLDESKNAYLIAVEYNGDIANDIICEEIIFGERRADIVTSTEALAGQYNTTDAFVMESLCLDDAMENSDAVSFNVYEDNGAASVQGTLEAESDVTIIIFDEDNTPVYAKRLTTSDTGTYTLNPMLPDAETTDYRALVYTDSDVFYADKSNQSSGGTVSDFRNWYFYDFNNADYWRSGNDTYNSAKNLGEIKTKGTGHPWGWRYSATGYLNPGNNGDDGDKYKFAWAGTDEDSFFGFNYAAEKVSLSNSISANRTEGPNSNVVNAEYEQRALNERMYITDGDWIDYEGTFVVSYDLYLPTVEEMQNGATAKYETYMMQEALLTTNGVSSYSAQSLIGGRLPVISAKETDGVAKITATGYYTQAGKVIEGNPTIIQTAAGETIGGSVSMDITDKAGRWITVQNVVTRIDEEGIDEDKYSISSYIDGKLITNGTNNAVAWYNPNAYAYEGLYKSPVAGRTIDYIAPWLQFRAVKTENFWGGVDNVRMTVYGETELAESVAVENNQTLVTVPVYNTAVNASDAPLGAKVGTVSGLTDGVTVKATKYSAEDVMMNNGTEIEVSLAAENPNKKYLTAPTECFSSEMSKSINGEEIYVNVPVLSEGERVVIEFEGLKDIVGNPVTKNSVVIYNGNAVVSANAEDYFGNALDFVYDSASSMNTIRSDVRKINLKYSGDGMLVLTDGSVTAATASSNGYEYEFNLSKTLLPETVYYVKSGSDVIMTFKTGEAVKTFGGLGSRSDGRKTVNYANTYTEPQTVVIIAAAYNGNVVCDISNKEETLAARKFGTLTTERRLSGGQSQDAFIVSGYNFDTAVENSEKISFAPFNNSRIATISGKLSSNEEAFVVVYNSNGEAVYAKRINTVNDGTYAFDVNFTGYTTDTYTAYIYSGTDTFKASRMAADPDENSTALLELKGLGSGSAVDAYLANSGNAEKLEFDYKLYASLSPAAKTTAANYLYTALSEIDVNDKEGAVEIFRNASVMAALTNNASVDFDEYIEDVFVLENTKVSKWFGFRTAIPENRTQKWRDGVVSRLKGQRFTSFEDFDNKFVEALVYEVVAEHGAAGVLMECVQDFNSDYIKAGVDGHQASYVSESYISRLSSDGKKYNSFDGFKAFIKDLKAYEKLIYYTESGTGTGGGGSIGGGGGGSISTVGLPNVSTGTSNAPIGTSGVFSDMLGYEWAKTAVEELAKRNIIAGKGNGRFVPSDLVLREEFAKLIVETAGLTDEADIAFTDVTADNWSYSYVKKAFAAGIINGMSDTQFGAGKSITRQDMAVIIYNVLKKKGVELKKADLAFEDKEVISDYAKDAVSALTELGVFNGYTDNTFRPFGNATRAEAAKVIYSILSYFE